MDKTKEKIKKFIAKFDNMPDRLLKYFEVLLLQKDASTLAYQDKSSFRRIAINPTTRCNLKCVWCQRNEPRIKRTLNKDLDFDKFKKFAPQLKGFKKVHIGGNGEFLIYPKLPEMIKLCRKYVPEVILTTNLTLLSKEMTHRLKKAGLTYLEASIDGFEKGKQQEYRGLGIAEIDKILPNLKYFSDHTSIPIQINSVLSSLNIKSLYPAIDKLKDIKNLVCMHTIKLFTTDFLKKRGIKGITLKQHKDLLSYWQKRAEKLGFKKIKFIPDIEGAELDPVITMKEKHNICFVPFEDPTIDCEGYLVPCGRLDNIKLENVFELGFDKAWAGPKTRQFRKDMLEGKYPYWCELECSLKSRKNLKK
jgi:MoaA/NifB/PqqE/SkfB family radical SAM enzyme